MNPKVIAEIQRCKQDFSYFANKYLKILDAENNKHIKFKPNLAQMRLYNSLGKNNWVYVLKARQLGMTTGVAGIAFWKALFTPNYRVAIIAHTTQSAKNIFDIYANYYNNLPDFLKVQQTASNVNEMKFITGSIIRVGSAASESFRGSTYNFLHLSEFAFYENIAKTTASIFQTATKNAIVIMETTPNGQNEAKDTWEADNGYEKLFISWLDGERYVSKEEPTEKYDFLEEFLDTLPCSPEQRNWAYETYRTKAAGDFNIFKQEYASDPTTCFISSGENYFNVQFSVQEWTKGYLEYDQKQKYSTYVMGVDVASGSPSGDFSSFVVLDITKPEKCFIAASYYDRIPPSQFAELVWQTASKYNALIVVENNSYGLSVLEWLQKMEYPYIYRKVSLDKIANKFHERLGFHTGPHTRPFLLAKLQKWVNERKIKIEDKRLQYEINTFVYNDKGKPIASGKKHDDIIFATALALQGFEQAEDEIVEETLQQKPANLREVLELEAKTGVPWEKMADQFPEPHLNDWVNSKVIHTVDDIWEIN